MLLWAALTAQKFVSWLVFIFLHILSTKYGKNVNDIYRDHMLACFGNVSGPQADRIKKGFINIFRKEFYLSIVCETNLKIVNFLDVTLDLTTGKYKHYNKPGNIQLYINIKFNHSTNIIKNLPESIPRHINKLSFNKCVFDDSKDPFNNALSSSGFKDKIKFHPHFNKNISRSKNRKRKIIWFNRPYSSNVSTNIGPSFSTILDNLFPK